MRAVKSREMFVDLVQWCEIYIKTLITAVINNCDADYDFFFSASLQWLQPLHYIYLNHFFVYNYIFQRILSYLNKNSKIA